MSRKVVNRFSLLFRDDVQWNEEQEKTAFESVQKNSTVTMTEEQLAKFENDANLFWDAFYDIHQNKFFKDRHWLFTEFPELKATATGDITQTADQSSGDHFNIFEIGCGVGKKEYSQDEIQFYSNSQVIPFLKFSR